jgi:SAM-dependent methyltransferase
MIVSSVRDHYEEVLGAHYSRMFGDFEAKVAEQRALVERLGVTGPVGTGLAVDLGCGSGFQSLALAGLGYRVLAIDFSERLLAELGARARGLPIEAVAGDIREVGRLVPSGVELVVCMGDTLSHLEREAEVERVLHDVAGGLAPGGRVVLTLRDLSGELRDLERAIPVCARDDLVVTCFLEYEPTTVKVHDLVWFRQADGWRFTKGVYRKLRLSIDSAIRYLEGPGLTVERHPAPGGLIALVGTRSGPGRTR